MFILRNKYLQKIMIVEVAVLLIRPGSETAFEQDFAVAGKYISAVEGYISHTLQKCLEQDNKYLLLVNWQSLQDHTIGFRQSPQYADWKKLLHHYYDPFPVVEHFTKVL